CRVREEAQDLLGAEVELHVVEARALRRGPAERQREARRQSVRVLGEQEPGRGRDDGRRARSGGERGGGGADLHREAGAGGADGGRGRGGGAGGRGGGGPARWA